jgi:recombination protein U
MNAGKQFEADFKKSVPNDIFYLRLKDGGGWSNAENTRFTASNEADCILYDTNNMFLLELKSHAGKSLPLSCIREKQIVSLADAEKKGVVAGIIVNMRDCEETYFLWGMQLREFMSVSDRKSIPIDYLRTNGTLIESVKKKVHFTYDILKFVNEFVKWC